MAFGERGFLAPFQGAPVGGIVGDSWNRGFRSCLAAPPAMFLSPLQGGGTQGVWPSWSRDWGTEGWKPSLLGGGERKVGRIVPMRSGVGPGGGRGLFGADGITRRVMNTVLPGGGRWRAGADDAGRCEAAKRMPALLSGDGERKVGRIVPMRSGVGLGGGRGLFGADGITRRVMNTVLQGGGRCGQVRSREANARAPLGMASGR